MSPITRKDASSRRIARLLCFTLAVLSALASSPVAAADATSENFHVHAFTINSQRAHKNYAEARCSKAMDHQPVWPNTNAAFKYQIHYGGGKNRKVRVPTTLFQHDYNVVSGKKPSTDEYVKEPVEVQPTILAEFCAELPYLLYRMWPKKSPLDRTSDDLFKVANHGCAVLRAMFRVDKQEYAKEPECSGKGACQPITKSANCYNTITRSLAHVISTYTDELELRQPQKPGAPNPRLLPKNKNLFQDKRTVDTFKALETVRKNLISRVKKIAEMDNGPQVLSAIAQVPPFAALGDVTSPAFAKNTIPVFAKTLTVFMLALEAEMLAQRIRRSEETSPWTSPVHKIRTSFDLNRQDARNLAVAFDKTEKGHFSFDVSFPATPIKSLAAAIGGKGMEYAAGDANQCDLFNPVVTTSINGHQWFHGSLAEGAVRLKNGVNAPMFTVNWFLPPAPKSTKDVTPRKVRKALVDHVQEKSPATMAIEVDVTTSVGSKACPNLPIIPASIFPAYACADSYQTCANQPLRSMADAPFAGEYYLGEPQFSAEDAFIEDDFVDEDAAGEFAFGDELDEDALDEDSAAEYALGDELLDADFSLSEEDFADEEGLDEADFSAEDALFADNSADTYAASYADSTLFE